MSTDPVTTGAVHDVERDAASRSRVQSYVSLRSAERALATCVAQLQDETHMVKARQLRLCIHDLRRESQDVSARSWNDAFVQADAALRDYTQLLRNHLLALSIPEVRSILPAIASKHRGEALALVDLLLAEELTTGESFSLLEYLITLLSVIDENCRKKISYDPVTITTRLAAYCRDVDASMEPSESADARREILQHADDLSDTPDPLRTAAHIRKLKKDLGPRRFSPDVLRALVTYNVRVANRLRASIDRSRAEDLTLCRAAFPDYDFLISTDFPDRDCVDPDTQSADQADQTDPAPAGPVPPFRDSEPIRELRNALAQRIRGEQMGTSETELVARDLDVSDLDEHEIAALTLTEVDETDSVIASSVLIGLLIASLPATEERFERLGIPVRALQKEWIREISEMMRHAIQKSLAENDYKKGCLLSSIKTRYLYRPLVGLDSDRPQEHRRERSQRSASSTAAKDPDAARRTEARRGQPSSHHHSLQESTREVAPHGSRYRFLRLAAAAAVFSVALIPFLSTRDQSDVVDLGPGELAATSHFLLTAYRNGQGSGRTLIGRVAPSYSALRPSARYQAASAIVRKFAADGVSEIILYGSRNRIVIHYAGHQLLLPKQTPAAPSPRFRRRRS